MLGLKWFQGLKKKAYAWAGLKSDHVGIEIQWVKAERNAETFS